MIISIARTVIPACRIAYRYAAGRPMTTRSTNATYLRHATVIYGRQQVGAWAMLPGWQRQLVRLVGPPLALGTLCAFTSYPRSTLAILLIAGLGAATWQARNWSTTWRIRRHRITTVLPLHRTLCKVLRLRVASPETWLHVPSDYRTNPAAFVGVQLPHDNPLTEATRKAIRGAVATRLGIHGWRETWHTIGHAPQVIFRPPLPMPHLADFRRALGVIDALRPGKILLGAAAEGRHVVIDLDDDAPHIAVAGETGCGKTALACAVAVQVLRQGGRVIICDIKGSHRWARGVPGIVYCRKLPEIHRALVWAAGEADRRNDANWESDADGTHPRLLIIFEEMNATRHRLADYWAQIRDKKAGDPKTSPALAGFADILSMGRTARTNVLASAQSFTARATGGPEQRENFGVRCLGRFTAQQWRMLCGAIKPPVPSRHPGRWCVVLGGRVVETQVLYAGEDSDPGTREWLARAAMPPVACRSNVVDLGETPATATSAATATGSALAVLESAPPAPPRTGEPLIGLREAVETGVIGVSLAAARRRIQRRQAEAPHPQGMGAGGELLYDPDDLRAFFGA